MKSSNRANYYYMWCSHKSRCEPLWESPAHNLLHHANISLSFWAPAAIPASQLSWFQSHSFSKISNPYKPQMSVFFLAPSARKRPIPYFRPSPSSISRSTSISSWSSIFTRSRSRSRSQSYSSYRSYSRSSSWNSVFGSCSRSRSRGSPSKRNRSRR